MKTLRILLLALLPAVLLAQVQSGTIVGTVSDPTGAVIPGAQVTLRNEGTGFQRVVKPNASGDYVAYSIPTGLYTIPAVGGQAPVVRSKG